MPMEKLKIVVTDSRGRVWKGELERIAPTPGRRIYAAEAAPDVDGPVYCAYRYSTHMIGENGAVIPIDVCPGSSRDVNAKIRGGKLVGLSNFSNVAMCPDCERFVVVLEKANDQPVPMPMPTIKTIVQCHVNETSGIHKRQCMLSATDPHLNGHNFGSWVSDCADQPPMTEARCVCLAVNPQHLPSVGKHGHCHRCGLKR